MALIPCKRVQLSIAVIVFRPSPGRLSEDLHNEYIPRAKHADATVDAISNMLSDIVGADRPHPDMTTHVVSRQ